MKKFSLIIIAILVVSLVAMSLVACDMPWKKWFNKDNGESANTTIADADAFNAAINEFDSISFTAQGSLSGDEIEGGTITIERLGNHSAHVISTPSGGSATEAYMEHVGESTWREYTKTNGAWDFTAAAYSSADTVLDIFAFGIFDGISSFSDYHYDESSKSYKASVNYNSGYTAYHYEITLKFSDGRLVYLHYTETYDTNKHSESEWSFSKHNSTSFQFPAVG